MLINKWHYKAETGYKFPLKEGDKLVGPNGIYTIGKDDFLSILA